MRYSATVAPRPHRRVVEAPLGAELALFHLDSRRLHVLNGSAAAIWRLLHEVDTIGDVAVRIGDAYGVSPIDVRGDIERTVDQLRGDGLLQVDERVTRSFSPRRPAPGPPVAVDLPASGSFAALDARVGFVCDDDEIATAISGVLAPLLGPEPARTAVAIAGDDDGWELRVGDADPIVLGSRLAATLRAIGEINNLAVSSVPDELVFHAGAVAIGGRGVLLPGASNHGKSTLTTALVGAGFAYLTDEAAAVTADLRIRPFPKAIALDPGSFPLFPELAPAPATEGLGRAVSCREWHVDPALVGTVGEAAPVHAIVCPHWRAGASTRVCDIDPVEALHLLLGDVFDFTPGGQPVFARLVELVQTVPVKKLSYGDTAEAVEAVHAIVDAAADG